jgi:hypothetical protein
MRPISKKQAAISLVTFASLGIAATMIQAQEVARVVSVTPNVRQVQTPKLVCTLDVNRNQTCSNQVLTQNVNDGFNVVYEYEGRLFTIFSATDPGPYIQLNIAQPGYIAPPATTYIQPSIYSSGFAPAYVQPNYPVTTFAPIVVRPFGHGQVYSPRPVVVIRGGGGYHHGGQFSGHYSGHYGGPYGGHRGFSPGHHGGRGHYR